MGSYGYLITFEATPDATHAIFADSRSLRIRFDVPRRASAGGLNLYGARAGGYPVNPTIIIDSRER